MQNNSEYLLQIELWTLISLKKRPAASVEPKSILNIEFAYKNILISKNNGNQEDFL